MRQILHSMPQGSWLLLQNEINDVPFLIEEGKACGLKIAVNPAPCTEAVRTWPLHLCDLILVNEIEAAQLTGLTGEGNFRRAAEVMAERFPDSEVVITLGSSGAVYRFGKEEIMVPARPVKVADTTSAGDTFTGYFLAAKLRGMGTEAAMRCAVFASSITVSRPGAAGSIPSADEVFRNSVFFNQEKGEYHA